MGKNKVIVVQNIMEGLHYSHSYPGLIIVRAKNVRPFLCWNAIY